MRKDKVHDEASETEAVEGVVVIEGPGGIAVLLTPGAADATADRLKETAGQARDQRPSADFRSVSVTKKCERPER